MTAKKEDTTPKSKSSTRSKKTTASKARKNPGDNGSGTANPTRKAPPSINKAKQLSKKDLEHFRTLLLQKRRELLGDVGHMANEALHHGRNESSETLSMPIHMADIGTDNYEQEFMLGLIEGDRVVLREIDWALNKVANSTYGFCEGTGNPINHSRLEAKPEARYCIDYARKIEQGLAEPIPLENTVHNGVNEE